MTQEVGFNGFSYLDLAAAIGVKNSSIHYHFKAKADLALALVERLRASHLESLSSMEAQISNPEERVAALAEHFKGYVTNGKICMCGMMAAELSSVSENVRDSLTLYFNELRAWLASQFRQMGRAHPEQQALQFLCVLEGAVLIARLQNDPALVDHSLIGLL
jgi:TetR/AcrR family transcriptional repressor of nem operon